MSNGRSNLEQLPPEIAREGVAPNLDKNAIANARCASTTMNRLFAPVLPRAELLCFVREANYEKALEMVEADPELMFKFISYKKDDGSYETISPLQFAFKNLDTYLWKMFLEKIIGVKNVHILEALPSDLKKYKDNHILVLGQLYSVNADGNAEMATIQNTKLFRRFGQQLTAQEGHINLEPLFAEYTTYEDPYNRWFQDEISNADIDEACLNLGKQQRDVLPRHMLKEFCRKGHSWNGAESKFDVCIDPWPVDTKIYNYIHFRNEPVLPLVSNSGLGFNFALIRGMATRARAMLQSLLTGIQRSQAYSHDLTTFRRLYDVRTADLVTLRSQFVLSAESYNVLRP